jgi:fructokinase
MNARGSGATALVIGESLVDVIRPVSGQALVRPGGSPLNVAVGLARLGVPTTLHSAFGADEYGWIIVRHLAESGVTVTPATLGGRTSVAEATIASDGAAEYRFDIAWDPAPIDTHGYRLVHTGSIGAALEPGAASVEQMIAQSDGLVSFDPNIRAALIPEPAIARERAERLVARADVVKASDEDVAWLYPGLASDEVLARWAALGPRLVVITHGAGGADALGPTGPLHVDVPPTTIVDTIGAGDSFMAGLLADVLIRGFDDPLASLGFAARCAAVTVSRVGADPPSRRELSTT